MSSHLHLVAAMATLLLGALLVARQPLPSRPHFLAIGDFGVDPDDPDHPDPARGVQSQILVGSALHRFVQRAGHPPLAVLVTGDAVYPHGINATFSGKFAEVMSRMPLDIFTMAPWLATPGNHDCEGDTKFLAEVDWPNWIMPRQPTSGTLFGQRTFAIPDSDQKVRVVFFDACLFVCSGETKDLRCEDGLQKYQSRENKLRYAEQMFFLERQVQPRSAGEFVIVVGHWPVFSFFGNGPTDILITSLRPLLHRIGANIYLCGHDHVLQIISSKEPKDPLFIVSGAGGYGSHKPIEEEVQALNRIHGARLLAWQEAEGFVSLSFAKPGVAEVALVTKHGEVSASVELAIV